MFCCYNFVCFSCRTHYRRQAWGGGTPTCAKCQQPCRWTGYRWRIPPKRDDKAWKAMEARFPVRT